MRYRSKLYCFHFFPRHIICMSIPAHFKSAINCLAQPGSQVFVACCKSQKRVTNRLPPFSITRAVLKTKFKNADPFTEVSISFHALQQLMHSMHVIQKWIEEIHLSERNMLDNPREWNHLSKVSTALGWKKSRTLCTVIKPESRNSLRQSYKPTMTAGTHTK